MASETEARQRKINGIAGSKMSKQDKQKMLSEPVAANPAVQYGSLPFIEACFYTGFTVGILAYLLFLVIKASSAYKDQLYPGDFGKGWTILGREKVLPQADRTQKWQDFYPKDQCDAEWEYWLNLKSLILVAFVLHSLGSLAVMNFLPKIKTWYYPMFTLTFLALTIGIKPVLYMLVHCVIMYFSGRTSSVGVVWATALCILATMQFDSIRVFQYNFLSGNQDHKDFTLYVSLMSLLRGIGFALESCWYSQESPNKQKDGSDDQPVQSHTFHDLLVFNFYLPVFAIGPLITYQDFYKQFYKSSPFMDKSKIIEIIWDFCRTVWWYIFLEVYLHYVYSAALLREPQVFMSLDGWTITGVMYSQLHIFLTKYVVLYRLSGVFARVDGIEPPGPPRCVSTLYLFGDMWRYFDRGLYLWMKRYATQ